MIKRILAAALLLISTVGVNAQYYFKDIVSNTQLMADMKAYKENKVKKITLKSFEDNGTESEGFFCEKKLNRDYTKTEDIQIEHSCKWIQTEDCTQSTKNTRHNHQASTCQPCEFPGPVTFFNISIDVTR